MIPVEADSGSMLELISFEIGGQEYCIDVRSVREIRGWTATTPMPQTPDYILGVINLRGAVMPVLDLRCRLGLGLTELQRVIDAGLVAAILRIARRRMRNVVLHRVPDEVMTI